MPPSLWVAVEENKEMGVSEGPALMEAPGQLTAKALAGQEEDA